MHIFPSHSLCWRSNLLHALLRQSLHNTRNTNWRWAGRARASSDTPWRAEESAPSTTRAGQQLHPYWCHLNLSQLPGVAPSPGVSTRPRRSRPSHLRKERGGRQHPGQQCECILINAYASLLHNDDLTCASPRFAPLRQSSHDTRNTNWTWAGRARASSTTP